MPVITRVTLLFMAVLIALFASKRATAAVRHLLCVCTLVGSLLLPVTALFPARLIAIRLPAIDAVAASHTVARAANWSSPGILLAMWAFGCGILLLRLAIGHWRIARLIRSSTPVQPTGFYVADVGVPVIVGLIEEVLASRR